RSLRDNVDRAVAPDGDADSAPQIPRDGPGPTAGQGPLDERAVRAVRHEEATSWRIECDPVDAFRGARGGQLEQGRPRARRQAERDQPVQPLLGGNETAVGPPDDLQGGGRVEE